MQRNGELIENYHVPCFTLECLQASGDARPRGGSVLFRWGSQEHAPIAEELEFAVPTAEGGGGVHNAAFAVAHALHELPDEDVSPCRQRTEGEPEGGRGFSLAVAGVEVDVALGPGVGVVLSIHISKSLALETPLEVESFCGSYSLFYMALRIVKTTYLCAWFIFKL